LKIFSSNRPQFREFSTIKEVDEERGQMKNIKDEIFEKGKKSKLNLEPIE